jgi:alpha-glucosidase
MGEELGLEDAVVTPERVVDPGGRDGCRAPIPWTAPADHGWGPEPWLPWPPEASQRSVERQRVDERSMLHLYRRLLALRRRSDALRSGDLVLIDGPADTLVYRRAADDDECVVAIHFGDGEVELDLDHGYQVRVSSDGECEGEIFDGRLRGDRAVVLTRLLTS